MGLARNGSGGTSVVDAMAADHCACFSSRHPCTAQSWAIRPSAHTHRRYHNTDDAYLFEKLLLNLWEGVAASLLARQARQESLVLLRVGRVVRQLSLAVLLGGIEVRKAVCRPGRERISG